MKKAFTLILSAITYLLMAFPLTLEAQTNCPAPVSATVSNISNSSAELGWTTTLIATHFNIQYRPLGSATWSVAIAQQVPFTLFNLACATGYEWQVQAVCANTGTGSFSSYTPGPVFTTLSCNTTCPAPTALTVTNVSATGAVLSWTSQSPAPGTTFNIQYQATPGTGWITINNVSSNLYQLGGLTCNTAYVFQVQAVCVNSATGAPTLSPWSQLITFITAPCTNSCPAPTGLTASNISATGAVLTWTAPAPSPNSFNLRYRQVSSPNFTVINNVGSMYQLGGLTCNTQYEWQVQSICLSSSGTTTLSAWSAPAFFTTAACQNACPAPTGLNATNVTGTGAVLTWNYVSPAPGTTFNIQYQSAGSTSWTTINNVTSPLYQLGGLSCNTVYIFQVQAVCLNSATGVPTLSPWSPLFTFVTSACPTNCLPPSGLTSTSATFAGVVLTWTAPAPAPITYNLRYKVVSAANWIVINNVSPPHTLTNLGCNANYEWQVQSVCANTPGTATVSSWTPSAFFTTPACPTQCPAPTGLNTTNITSYSALASWNRVAGAIGYQVRYRAVGSLAWIYTSAPSNSKTLTNLICGIHYEWQVRAHCGPVMNNNVNPFSPSATFTTVACNTTCLPPTGLSVSNITSTSAALSWNATTAPMYRVRYRISGSGMLWLFQITPNTNITLTNLMPSSLYEWQVQSMCSPSSNTVGSPWSTLQTFQTLQGGNNLCPAPTGLAATGVSQQGAVFTWNAVAGAMAYNVRYRPANSTINYVTATTTTNLLQVGNLVAGTVYEWQVQAVCVTPNGATTLSPWSVTSIFTTPLLLSVYPNPVDRVAYVSFTSDDASMVTVEIRDLFGKVAYTEKHSVTEGLVELVIPTQNLHEGIYTVAVTNSQLHLGTTRLLISR